MKKEMYYNIISASGIEAGDLVLVQYWMGEEMSEDVEFLQAAIASVGATPLLMIQKLSMSQAVNENICETTYGDKYFGIIEAADVVIDLIERPIGLIKAPLEPEKMALLGGYMQRLFRTCATKKKMLQLRVPTEVMAMSEGLEYEDYKTRMEAAMDIDYEALKKACEELKSSVEQNHAVTIKTNDGTCELSLELADREWGIDAGDGDIPCGEISVAPIETSTNGEVFFEEIYVPDLEERKNNNYKNVILTIENGIIVKTNNDELTDYFAQLDAADKTICELGIGMNPGVTSLCGCALLDEKMIGTFHLGIGDNTMFGGENQAEDHNDLIGKGDLCWS